jgi:hypothetical protein
MEEQMELFEDGGLRDEGGMVDEESGNEVPNGSTRKEVRDDVPAMLSEGEFVLPADVVRYHGLEKIMQLRDEAKLGLKKMEAMGQMGNSDEATLDDDMPFSMADIVIIGEPMEGEEEEPREMAQGGMVYAQGGTFVQPSTGIAGFQPSIYQGQQTTSTYTPPPSSVAPPAPQPSPAGGYLPKFVTSGITPFDDATLESMAGAPTTTDLSGVSTASTEGKFVPTVEDEYTTLKYINNETGEVRDFYFYKGNPVTPIPDGFVPYDESVNETVDDLESTAVETTQLTGSDDNGGFTVPDAEPVDYSSFSKDELMAAFDQNKTARTVLTAMGVVNPMIALFGRFATGQQQNQIIDEMKKRGITPPETSKGGNIIDRIGDFVSNIFGKDKEEVKRSIVSSAGSSSDLTSSLRPVSRPDQATDDKPMYFTDAIRAREEKKKEEAIANARRDTDAILATSMGTTAKERAERTGMTPVQTVAKATEKDKPVFAADSYDPRGKDQMGTPGKDSSAVTKVNTAANKAAAKAVSQQQAVGKTESIQQKIQRGGGFSKGGLASRKNKK